jgi:3-methyladenine DNA glycosylase AlkD
MYDTADHREERYAALVLAGHRCARRWQDPEVLVPYRHLVVTGAWWDLVDWVAGQLLSPIRRAYPKRVNPLVRAWAVDDDLWLRRTAILSQLGGHEDIDLDLLADCLGPNLERPEFWLRKASGWALREVARYHPSWVLTFVDRHHDQMSGLTRREATKHLGKAPPPA